MLSNLITVMWEEYRYIVLFISILNIQAIKIFAVSYKYVFASSSSTG